MEERGPGDALFQTPASGAASPSLMPSPCRDKSQQPWGAQERELSYFLAFQQPLRLLGLTLGQHQLGRLGGPRALTPTRGMCAGPSPLQGPGPLCQQADNHP